MEQEKTFRTKTGFCHILPDKIVLTRDGLIGEISKITVGNSISRILIIYSVLTLGLFYYAFGAYQEENYVQTILYSVLGLALIIGIINSMNNSTAPVIHRHQINEVKFSEGMIGITRSRFVVKFKNDKGQIKKRLIMLPGSMSQGEEETIKVVQIMKKEGFLIA